LCQTFDIQWKHDSVVYRFRCVLENKKNEIMSLLCKKNIAET